MNVPQPLPDELALSVIARVRRLNGINHCDASVDRRTPRRESFLAAIARRQAVPMIELLARHTPMPFYGFVQTGAQTWNSLKPCAQAMAAGRGNARRLRLCSSCVVEDYDFWGVSYWRRVHQLPGVTECDKHSELLRVTLGEDRHSLPQDHVETAVPISRLVADHARTNDCIARYVRISAELLNAQAPITADRMVDSLQSAASRTQRPRGRTSGEHLSDLVAQRAAGPWLYEHFPEFRAKRRGVAIPTIDRTYSARGVAQRTVAYVLVLAALHETADDALLSLKAPSPVPNPIPKTGDGAATDKLNRALRLFLDGLPLGEACKRTRTSARQCEAVVRSLLQVSAASQVTSLRPAE